MRKTKEENRIAKELLKIENEKNQKPVKSLTISIEWKKSRMWGHNPHATAMVSYHDGTYEHREGYKASGCGYDKASTVVAEIFNDFLNYKLWAIPLDILQNKERGKTPYGIVAHYESGKFNTDGIDRNYRYYSGGIGMSCFPAISEYIGGKFETVANGNSFDVYKYVDG